MIEVAYWSFSVFTDNT